MDTITGRVIRVQRHGHTAYGNPIMSVVLDTDEWGVSHRISDNASLVYGIENAEYRDEPHTFMLTRAGRISHVAPCPAPSRTVYVVLDDFTGEVMGVFRDADEASDAYQFTPAGEPYVILATPLR